MPLFERAKISEVPNFRFGLPNLCRFIGCGRNEFLKPFESSKGFTKTLLACLKNLLFNYFKNYRFVGRNVFAIRDWVREGMSRTPSPTNQHRVEFTDKFFETDGERITFVLFEIIVGDGVLDIPKKRCKYCIC